MADDVDGDLLARFVHGDRDAFARIFRQYEREVYRWILRIVRDPPAAEDALIEAFWRAYRSRARFDPSRSFGAWMRRIATNAAIDQVKAARRRAWVPLGDPGGGEPAGRHDLALADSVARAFARCRRSCRWSRRLRSSRSVRMRKSPTRCKCRSEP